MRTRLTILAGCALAGVFAASGVIQAQTLSADNEQVYALQQEEQNLLVVRADLPAWFAEAYMAYPQIPHGVLESIAHQQSRWMPLQPDPQQPSHLNLPPAYGVMGLYAGDGFADQVGQAARLTGFSPQQIKAEDRTNILAAAALLAREIDVDVDRLMAGVLTPEQIVPALERYAGFSADSLGVGQRAGGVVDDFARESFAYEVLLTLDTGVNEKGMLVPEVAIDWERAFPPDVLVRQQAPFVRLDVRAGAIEVDGYVIDPLTETLVAAPKSAGDNQTNSTDYGPALWNPAHPSNYSTTRGKAISAVTIHTMQGSYAGSIAWFKNPASNVSAHYMVRSSDGQITQMVRDAHKAWHVGSENPYTLGIEHEGYVNNSSWYTSAMYNASSALVRNFCAKYAPITCASAYHGAASGGLNVQPASVRIKGHQHFPNQTHTDPGQYWNWTRYYGLLNPGSGGTTRVLDNFESSVGHFTTSPTYSGSTVGIATSSTALRNCDMKHAGSCSLQLKLVDNPASSANWSVRLLSGAGNPSANVGLQRASGKIGFWVYAAGNDMNVAVGIDDSDGTERSITRALSANRWTYVEWDLTNSAHWNAWVGGNGAITAATVTLDAIWVIRTKPTTSTVYMYVDDVTVKN